MKPTVKRKGKFLKRMFCDHDWTFAYSKQWPLAGTIYYKWCSKCDRLERMGFICDYVTKEERAERWEELRLPSVEEMIPYCCHPDNGKDLIQRRIDAGFNI